MIIRDKLRYISKKMYVMTSHLNLVKLHCRKLIFGEINTDKIGFLISSYGLEIF